MDQGESGRIHFTEQTNRLGNSTRGVLSVTLFLVAINGLLGELGSGVDESIFADNLTIYITTRNQRVAARTLQGMTNKLDAWATESGLT